MKWHGKFESHANKINIYFAIVLISNPFYKPFKKNPENAKNKNQLPTYIVIFKRPEAVLHTPMLLTNFLIKWWFEEISLTLPISQTVRARKLKFWGNVHFPLWSHVTCHTYRINYRIISFLVENEIIYVILANTIPCIVKNVKKKKLVSLANRMVIM